MIELHGLNGAKFYLNQDTIEKIEQVPETVITLINDRKYLVKEDVEEIKEKIINFKRNLYGGNIR